MFAFRAVWIAFKQTKTMMADPEMREMTNFRHVLVVAQRTDENPNIAIARHFTLYPNQPSMEDALQLRNEVLEDDDLRTHINFAPNVNYSNLTVVSLGNFSEPFVRGLFGIVPPDFVENK